MSDMLAEGIQLMVLGMGTVFVFLVILIFGTSLMSAVLRRLPQTPQPVGGSAHARRPSRTPDEIAAVAAAAYAAHNNAGRS